MRIALQLLWNLNIKAIPSAMVWAISFWFTIESHSLVVRSTAIIIASLAAMISSVIVVNEWSASAKASWKNSFGDRFNWKSLVAAGLLLDFSTENLRIVDSGSYLAKTVFLSIFLSCLILWLFTLLILLPLRTEALRKESPIETFARALNLVRGRKRYILVSYSVILFAWPIFFVYMFLAFTFAQCVIVSSYGESVDASFDSPKKRVQVA